MSFNVEYRQTAGTADLQREYKTYIITFFSLYHHYTTLLSTYNVFWEEYGYRDEEDVEHEQYVLPVLFEGLEGEDNQTDEIMNDVLASNEKEILEVCIENVKRKNAIITKNMVQANADFLTYARALNAFLNIKVKYHKILDTMDMKERIEYKKLEAFPIYDELNDIMKKHSKDLKTRLLARELEAKFVKSNETKRMQNALDELESHTLIQSFSRVQITKTDSDVDAVKIAYDRLVPTLDTLFADVLALNTERPETIEQTKTYVDRILEHQIKLDVPSHKRRTGDMEIVLSEAEILKRLVMATRATSFPYSEFVEDERMNNYVYTKHTHANVERFKVMRRTHYIAHFLNLAKEWEREHPDLQKTSWEYRKKIKSYIKMLRVNHKLTHKEINNLLQDMDNLQTLMVENP